MKVDFHSNHAVLYCSQLQIRRNICADCGRNSLSSYFFTFFLLTGRSEKKLQSLKNRPAAIIFSRSVALNLIRPRLTAPSSSFAGVSVLPFTILSGMFTVSVCVTSGCPCPPGAGGVGEGEKGRGWGGGIPPSITSSPLHGRSF